MELTRAGMKVLILEAGSAVDPARDFHHTFLYQMDYRGSGKPGLLRRYAGTERNYRITIDNVENPYTTSPQTNYRWGRSRCLGGRTLHWARSDGPDGRLRVQGRLTRRLRHGLAALLCRPEAVLRSRRGVHRCQRHR